MRIVINETSDLMYMTTESTANTTQNMSKNEEELDGKGAGLKSKRPGIVRSFNEQEVVKGLD
jgi:hypothetical protein